MVQNIIDLFCRQAREHKAIRSFYYDRNYEMGSGNENHPLFWLEDPLTGRNNGSTFTATIHFSILFVPQEEIEVARFQNLAFSIGLNILERIKSDESAGVSVLPTWSFLTLRNYYDNNACGCRFTAELVLRNMQNLCLIEEQFDPEKAFETNTVAKHFDLKTTPSSAIFAHKLPIFDLKTTKQ